MSNYQLSKIYCIRGGNEIYIGSTIQKDISSRFSQHKRDYKLFKAGKCRCTTSYFLFDKYGVEKCTINILEVYPCNSVKELRKKEGEYITTTNCVNKNIAGRTAKEYNKEHKEQIKEYNKEYSKEHKEQIKEYKKEYNKEHKEQIKEQKKEYNKEHKEQIKEKRKEYYEEHKKEILEKNKKLFTCECGSELTIQHKARHEKSKKHLKFVSKII